MKKKKQHVKDKTIISIALARIRPSSGPILIETTDWLRDLFFFSTAMHGNSEHENGVVHWLWRRKRRNNHPYSSRRKKEVSLLLVERGERERERERERMEVGSSYLRHRQMKKNQSMTIDAWESRATEKIWRQSPSHNNSLEKVSHRKKNVYFLYLGCHDAVTNIATEKKERERGKEKKISRGLSTVVHLLGICRDFLHKHIF